MFVIKFSIKKRGFREFRYIIFTNTKYKVQSTGSNTEYRVEIRSTKYNSCLYYSTPSKHKIH